MFAPFEKPTATSRLTSKLVVGRSRFQEFRQVVGPDPQVLEIENPFREAPEEAGHPALEHFPSRAQHPGRRRDHLRDRQQILFVPAGAVQRQQDRDRMESPGGSKI